MIDDLKNLYPVRKCEFEEVHDGLIIVLFKKTKFNFIDKILFRNRLNKTLKIDLDEIGSFVWRLCDGNVKISEIADKTKTHFGDRVEPVLNRVSLFVNRMSELNLIQLYKKKSVSIDSQ